MTRRAVAVLAASLLLVLAACSSDSEGGSKGDKTDKGNGKGKDRVALVDWDDAVKDPCKLLPKDAVEKAAPKAKVAAGPSVSRICTWDLGGYRTAGVELFLPQTDASFASRTVGQPTYEDVVRPVLASPGAAIFVRNGSALALVTVRASVADREAGTQVDELAAAVKARLPEGPEPGTAFAERDLCDLVPSTVFGKQGITSLDLQSPQSCGYRLEDQTSVSFQFTPSEGGAGSLFDGKWPGGGEGATWDPLGNQGAVPIEGGVLYVSTASPVRKTPALQELAAKVVGPVRKAAGG